MLIPIPPNLDPNLRVFLQGLAEQVQIGAGQRGDSLDKNVTWGDLLRANIAEVSPTSGFVNPLYRENPLGEGSGTPPSVKEVSVDGGLGSYLVTFALPTQPSAAWSHAEIWGYEYDGLGTTPDKAVLLGVSATGVYTFDPTRDGSEDSWVFFVRFVRGEEYGPWHDNAGVVASRPITPQKFYEQSIAGLGIDDLQQATADNALAIQQQGGTLSDHAQLIADNANSLGNITFGNLNPLPNTATVDLLTNGSGLFLNAQGETVFAAAADKFALYTPSITDLGELELNTPFFVSGGQTYIKSAFIEEATIQNAVTGSLISDRIVADNVSFEAAQIADGAITNAKIAGTLQSDSYSGSTGWRLEQNGKLTCYNGFFANITASGNIEASSLKSNSANIVSTLMLQGQAVTISSSAFSSTGITVATSYGTGAYHTVLSLTFTSTGAPVDIHLNLLLTARANGNGDGTSDVALFRGDTIISSWPGVAIIDIDTSGNSPAIRIGGGYLHFTYRDTSTTTGARTYHLKVRGNPGGAIVGKRFISALEVKR